jgi:hypothetical protein
MNRQCWKLVYISGWKHIGGGAEGRKAGVSGGVVADVIGDIRKCIGEVLWWLPMDYYISVKGSDTPADRFPGP